MWESIVQINECIKFSTWPHLVKLQTIEDKEKILKPTTDYLYGVDERCIANSSNNGSGNSQISPIEPILL